MNKQLGFFLLPVLGLVAAAALCPPAFAEEGMWLPEQLPELAAQLKNAGLEIDTATLAEKLGAVVQLGGCSASFISPDGLLITNYHCAIGSIQQNSTVEKNLLENGFLARERGEELPASPTALVFIIDQVEDVTARITAEVAGVEGQERAHRLELLDKSLVTACEKAPGSRCEVSSFYGGLNYRLYRYREVRDIRLVYAPPYSVGQFGGELDNFMWPRQTADFALFRVYVGPDGRAADRSPDNVPMHPAQFLKVARRPLKESDFVMVVGTPGKTERYRLAFEAEREFEWKYPRAMAADEKRLATIEEATRQDEALKLKYAAVVAGINNTLKFTHGMVDSYRSSGLLEAKRELESDLTAWIAGDEQRRAKFGQALARLEEALQVDEGQRDATFRYSMAGVSSLLNAAKQIYLLAREKEKPDAERRAGFQDRDRDSIRRGLTRIESRFDPKVDRAVWRAFLLEYQELPAGQRRTDFDLFFGIAPGQDAAAAADNIDRQLATLYSKTRLADLEYRLGLLEVPREELDALPDPFIALARSLIDKDLEKASAGEERAGRIHARRSDFMAAVLAFMSDRGEALYPDANGTLRISYGTLKGNTSADGKAHGAFTVAEDLVRRSTGQEPYATPENIVRALRERRLAGYADKVLGSLPINFMANADVTGGHSGSPTLNGQGDLVGLLFDTNYESAISKWRYVPSFSRSVHLDIRYVLWLLDEIEHADPLLAELGLQPTRSRTIKLAEPSSEGRP